MANRLAAETSPYLLQHKDNPVDWYPWGDEAIEMARRQDLPILLSIGYSSCHWCHVMERESFEDNETADYINTHFVAIKVDREERPDIDAVYMEAVQGMTGGGGWPLTVFLTPALAPFYGGTYFPPQPSSGMPSFFQIMEAAINSWRSKREQLESAAEEITRQIAATAELRPSPVLASPQELNEAELQLHANFDSTHGGFGTAPKFPPASALEFLIARYVGSGYAPALEVAEKTLTAMAEGGIYDQIGGGFARYSVDQRWLVPHFEKMLYDNAQLARSYLHGWQITKNPLFKTTCSQIMAWMIEEMQSPEGGFYSAYDADSEGVEGRFYVWSKDEIEDVLGELATPLIGYWGVTESGNFEGSNILNVADRTAATSEQISSARQLLYEHRSRRVWPQLDGKRLTAWNSLAISALAETGAALGNSDFTAAALKCANFIDTEMTTADGRLLRTFNNGQAKQPGFLEDYAFTVEAYLNLYQADFNEHFFVRAWELAETMIELFVDRENGGFFSTEESSELPVRRKEFEDHPIPSGNSSAAIALLKIHALTGEQRYETLALETLRLTHEAATQHPQAFAYQLCALDYYFGAGREIALVGDDPGPMLAIIRSEYRPHTVVAAKRADKDNAVPLLHGRTPREGSATAYVCQNFSCNEPTTDPDELGRQLGN